MSSTLSVGQHISRVCSASYFIFKKLTRIKHYMDMDTRKMLSQALVISKLDYCNSLLAGAPRKEFSQLQSVQNMCARFVTGIGKCDHISPTLESLHWFKIPYRVEYKIIMLVYKIFKKLHQNT